MRIRTLILCLLFCVASSFAKDVITKTDGTKLDAKVEEITETVIKYRKASNPTGPVYTIPIASVASVLYENGDIDTFNTEVVMPDVPTVQKTSPSDEDLIGLAESLPDDKKSDYVSDAQLLKMAYGGGNTTPMELLDKAKKYKKVGWIGGGVLVATGVFLGWYFSDFDLWGLNSESIYPIFIVAGVVVGSAWCLGFNLQANSLMKQAKQMQSYSTTLIENEIIQFGNNKLTAGINLMGNRMVNSHSLGVSLGLNF